MLLLVTSDTGYLFARGTTVYQRAAQNALLATGPVTAMGLWSSSS